MSAFHCRLNENSTSSALKSRVGLKSLQRMELDALAQMEGDRLAAVGDVPALGQAGHDLGGAALEFGQAVVDRPRGVEAGAGGVDRRAGNSPGCLRSNRRGSWPTRRSSPAARRPARGWRRRQISLNSPRTSALRARATTASRDPPGGRLRRHRSAFFVLTQWARTSGRRRRGPSRAGRSGRAPRARR